MVHGLGFAKAAASDGGMPMVTFRPVKFAMMGTVF